MCIISGEIKRQGLCELSIDEISARAGVCRTTTQNAVHQGRCLGHITVQERPRPGLKNLTNIVRICSQDWLAWIKRGPSASKLIGSNSAKKMSPTVIIDLRKKEANVKRGQYQAVAAIESS